MAEKAMAREGWKLLLFIIYLPLQHSLHCPCSPLTPAAALYRGLQRQQKDFDNYPPLQYLVPYFRDQYFLHRGGGPACGQQEWLVFHSKGEHIEFGAVFRVTSSESTGSFH